MLGVGVEGDQLRASVAQGLQIARVIEAERGVAPRDPGRRGGGDEAQEAVGLLTDDARGLLAVGRSEVVGPAIEVIITSRYFSQSPMASSPTMILL